MISISVNVAPFLPAYQSSDYYDGGRGTADKAVDADFNNDETNPLFYGSVTHTKSLPNSWWSVDLGSRIKVKTVLITNRRDCCRKSLYMYLYYASPHFLKTS